MRWYQFASIAMFIAVGVRVDALRTTPYWSWAELVPSSDPEESSGRIRRTAIVRRFFYAYGGGIALLLVWDQLTALDAVWVGGFAGVLVIWPAVYHQAQGWLDWRRLTAYGSFVVLTASSSFAGALTGELFVGQDDPVEFLRENALRMGLWCVHRISRRHRTRPKRCKS